MLHSSLFKIPIFLSDQPSKTQRKAAYRQIKEAGTNVCYLPIINDSTDYQNVGDSLPVND